MLEYRHEEMECLYFPKLTAVGGSETRPCSAGLRVNVPSLANQSLRTCLSPCVHV